MREGSTKDRSLGERCAEDRLPSSLVVDSGEAGKRGIVEDIV